MKQIIFGSILLIVSCGLTNLTIAQTKQNQFLVGGQYSLNYSSNTSTFNGSNNSFESGKSRSFQITPQVGYFIFNHAAAGIEFIYRYNKEYGQEIQGVSNYDFTKNLLLIPFFRYYFGNGKVMPYLHTGIGPGWQKTGSKNYSFPETTQKTKLLFYELRGGLAFFINQSVSFDFGIGYESQKTLFNEPMVEGPSDKWNTLEKGIKSTLGIVVSI